MSTLEGSLKEHSSEIYKTRKQLSDQLKAMNHASFLKDLQAHEDAMIAIKERINMHIGYIERIKILNDGV